jgi:preprotein translocase SecE subunit
MSITSKQEQSGKKWIQTSVAIGCFLVFYVFNGFFTQIGEWWELERFVPNYFGISQVVAVLIGFATFLYITKNPKTSSFLREVFNETVKVVWPNRDETNRHTIGIMIGVTIVGFVLGFFDFVAGYLLSLIN